MAAKFRVKSKDIFNVKEFYSAIRQWFLEYDWSSVDSKGNLEKGMDHWETHYWDRMLDNGSKEMWWIWRLQKIPDDNSYFKYHLDIDMHPLGITQTEVMRDGKKMPANKGEVDMWVYAYLEFDYKQEWSKHWFLKYFHKIFPKRILRQDLYELHKLELYREAYTFQAYVKKWFKINSFLPYEEITPFYPERTYPKWKKE